MKIAVISDIHGNMQALESVLKDIEHVHVDKIYCLGDLALAGPEPSKAIKKIMEMNKDGKVDLLQGNTDLMIVEHEKFIPIAKKSFPVMGNALEYDVKVISDEERKFLKNLPKQIEEVIEDVKILFVHGSPRKNDENIFPNLPIEEVEEIIKSTDADLILCGHTHIPCGYQTSTKQTVVNAGSVGRPFMDEPKACYAILTLENGSINVEHKLVAYDKEKAAEILKSQDFDGSDKLANMLIKPETRHV